MMQGGMMLLSMLYNQVVAGYILGISSKLQPVKRRRARKTADIKLVANSSSQMVQDEMKFHS